MTVLLYGIETLSLLAKYLDPLSILHTRCQRRPQICGISLRHHITNQNMLLFLVSFSLEVRGLGGVVVLPDAADCPNCCFKDDI